MHAGIGMDVWAVDAQTASLIGEALALSDQLSLSVRQGMPLRFTRHQVLAAYVNKHHAQPCHIYVVAF